MKQTEGWGGEVESTENVVPEEQREERVNTEYLKLVVCILLRVLGQVQGFRLTQH
jgi:hypothetical protein